MTAGERVELTELEIGRLRERFGEECKRMLEALATRAHCTCTQSSAHEPDCPVSVFREAAHAVWLWGQAAC